MAFELKRVPFHVPGCDILSGRRAQPASVRVDPGERRAMEFDGAQEMAERLLDIALDKHECTMQEEATEVFHKVLLEESVDFPALKAVCARLLDNANNNKDGGKGIAFIMTIQLFIGLPQSKHFLFDVRDKGRPAADNTDDARKIAFALTGRHLQVVD